MNENIVLKKPYFKKNTYISELKEDLIFNLNNINIKNILKSRDYYILDIYLNDRNDKKMFIDIDNKILDKYNKKNKKWFSNDLNEDDIISMYKKSYCEHNNTIDMILNDSTIILKNNEEVFLTNDIINDLKKKNNQMLIETKLIGIYISDKQITNKWLITKLNIDYVNEENVEVDKLELEKEWHDTLNETIEYLTTKQIEYQKKCKEIDIFKEININLLAEIKNINNDKNWNQKINILKNNIKNILSINDSR